MARPRAYFDTSVLVKRYIREPGAARARSLMRRYRFLSSVIAPVEAMSAFCRRRAAGELSPLDYAAILRRMRADREYWELVEAAAPVLDRAEELIQQADLRTLDALHLASAMVLRAGAGVNLPFVTADARQRDAARQMELEVVWVGEAS